ncbi:MAG: hypothetical protein IPO92_08090 [Saprospiraceae bacterium]|nr:hypothetical protein [Saprospiraceae bacterium]
MEDNSNLEKYFRQQFSQNIPQEPWNTPDEIIWANISNELDKKPNRRNLLLFLPWLLTSLMFLFSMYTWKIMEDHSIKIRDLEKRIEKCNNGTKITDDKTDMEITNVGKKEVSPTKTINSSSYINPTYSVSENSPYLHSYRANKNSTINAPQNNGSLATEALKDQYTNLTIVDEKNKLVIVNEEKQSERLIVIIPAIANRKSAFFPSIKNVTFPDYVHNLPENKVPVHAFYIGFALGSNQWKDKTSGSFDNPLSELLTNEKTNASISYGIQTSYTINNHLTTNLGLYYNKRNQHSTYLLHIPYTTSTEILDASGEYTNTFKHSLPTGLGNVQTDLLLSRSQSSSIGQNEIIDLDFSFNNSVSSILAPISLSYFPKQSNDGFFINAGLQSEFVINDKVSDIKSLSHHTFVKDKQVNVNFESSQINKFNISALAGLGYQKSIWKKIDLMASCQYGFALTDTYSTDTYKHKLNNLSFNVSLVRNIVSN